MPHQHLEPVRYVAGLTPGFLRVCALGLLLVLALAATPLLLGVAGQPGYGWVAWACSATALAGLLLFLWALTLGTSLKLTAEGVEIRALWFFSTQIPYNKIRTVTPGPVLGIRPGTKFPQDWDPYAYRRQATLNNQEYRGKTTKIQGFSTGGPTLVFTLANGQQVFASVSNPERCALTVRKYMGFWRGAR